MQRLDAMVLFAEVADCGSFSAAARHLGVPKSTVSQQIALLEGQLGVRLLHRTTRRVSLTDAGAALLPHCRTLRDAARAAEAAVSRRRLSPSGTLRITAPEASGIALLPDILDGFGRRYPEVRVETVITDRHLDLVAERIDIALRTGRLDDSSFISRRIGRVGRALAASPAYLAEHGVPEHPDDLEHHACLMHASASEWPLGEGEARRSVVPVAAERSNSLSYLVRRAETGGGIVMAPRFLCAQALAQGRLVEVLADHAPADNEYYAVYPSRRHPSAALLAFLGHLDDAALAERLAGRSGTQRAAISMVSTVKLPSSPKAK
ncbi:LysR family transcriptional regulator [Paludibacterium paludis]|uniref:LysR family transcriptional regulator n=2 Tax=Paludibacterium paludis TaxID=1225769 RepID=A0A918P668_9NEIS|nr:LysR family transcriptional regulator [Paludibacterium paludis]GGY24916.1 LysR family transcriptional regulator [Paludibacterium paludis]